MVSRPGAKVLYMSGYVAGTIANRDLVPGATFLQKPFTPAQLVQRIEESLGISAPATLIDEQAGRNKESGSG